MSKPFDPGLQPERTGLAWQRTALALMVGSLVAARILGELAGPAASLFGFAGAIASVVLLLSAHRRYGEHHRRLVAEGDRAPLADARLIAYLTVLTSAAGLVAIGIVLLLAWRSPL